VLAQRRLRSIGMLAAQGATQSNMRLVVRVNGVATGVIGAVAGFALGLVAWLAYRPHVQASAHHVIGAFQLPWMVVWVSMGLAVLAAYAAAARPARTIARVPVVSALSGRPPAPKPARHLTVPFGLGFLVLAFFLLGMAGAGVGTSTSGASRAQLQEVVLGFVALMVAVVLLSPACLAVLARFGRWTPVMVRLALRNLARYRARSGPVVAASSLSVLIASIVGIVSAARFGGAVDYVGPNLTSSQLIVYPPGHGTPNGPPPTASQLAATRTAAQRIAASLDDRYLITLETPSGSLQYGGSGRGWSGTVYVATPQLLNAFGITPAQVNRDADFLTMRPGLPTTQHMQLWDTRKALSGSPCLPRSCLANPPIQEVGALPSGTSAPNTVITEHAMRQFHFTATTVGWLIQAPGRLTATGASGTARRTLTAATAGALALTGAVTGTAGGYIAAIGFFCTNQLDQLSELDSVPVAVLVWILAGMPLIAVAGSWLLAGREPPAIARQPLE
jgi:putative ABC transport system permease protein